MCMYSVLFMQIWEVNNQNELIPLYSHCLQLYCYSAHNQRQLHQSETRPGQDAHSGGRVLKMLNWHRGVYLHHLPHAPAPAWIMYTGFSCSAETLASAAATAPADSCDQKVPLNPLQQLLSICDHWAGDRSCSVCQLLFLFLVKQGQPIIQSVRH